MITVLLVEDQRDLVAGWRLRFSSYASEFALETATCVVEALQIVEKDAISFAFVDIGLPYDVSSADSSERAAKNENGLELLSLLQDAYDIPAVALTGTTDPAVRRLIRTPLVEKPVEDFQKEIIDRLRENHR